MGHEYNLTTETNIILRNVAGNIKTKDLLLKIDSLQF